MSTVPADCSVFAFHGDADAAPVEAALHYAAHGWRVLPREGKRPLAPRGFHAASTDAALIRAWWRKWPRAHVGIATGCGVVVLDVDPKHGGEVDPAWPKTLAASTPSGGLHLFYSRAERVPSSVGRIARGVDVRAEGGYVAAPPEDGREWIAAPLAPLPSWLLASCRASVPGSGRALRRGPFVFRERVAEGGRNEYMVRAVGTALHRGHEAEDMPEWALEHNRRVCVPPLDEDEVLRIVASITRRHERSASSFTTYSSRGEGRS